MICALCAASDRTTCLEMQQHGVRFASHKMLSANRRNVCDHVPKTACLYSHVGDVQSEVAFEEVCRSRAHKNSCAMAIYACNLKSEVIKSSFQPCSEFAMAGGPKRKAHAPKSAKKAGGASFTTMSVRYKVVSMAHHR